jgi:hypothetical protein
MGKLLTLKMKPFSSKPLKLLTLLIGEKKELFLMLKIKDNVVHVGLSLQLDLLKDLTISKMEK